MIKSYLEFINESLHLILESDVVYSDKMRLTLSKIENPIAKKLLEIENKDYPVRTNYFDIVPGKNDKISFIPDRKAQDILSDSKEMFRYVGSGGWLKHKAVNSNIFLRLGYSYEEGVEPYSPDSSDKGELISKVTSEISGRVYAWVKFKNINDEYVGEGVYNFEKLRPLNEKYKLLFSKNRQNINVGKAVKAILDITGFRFTPHELEIFVNGFKSTVDKLNDKFLYFELVSGEEIGKFYNNSNYLEKSGKLGSSCMASSPVKYFSIYIENPDVCKLLILKSEKDETKITGRALLWTLSDGQNFLDRVYTINDSDVELFKDYAKENGWYSKRYNNSSADISAINPNGDYDNTLVGKVLVKPTEHDSYPYLDTFKYFNPKNGILSIDKIDSNDYKLESTTGGYIGCEYCDGSGRTTCNTCDGSGDLRCRNCRGQGTESCYECRGDSYVSCGYCEGEWVIEGIDGEETECSDCDGRGNVSCRICDGQGETECSDCNGNGRLECDDCLGSGSWDCGECG